MNRLEIKNGLLLGGGALTAMLIIVAVFKLTSSTIETTEKRQLESDLVKLFEPNSFDNEPALDVIYRNDDALGGGDVHAVYRARNNGKPTGVVVAATALDGYNGAIKLLVGLNYAGDVVAVRVTDHSETPGLGDDIEVRRSDWILSFDNLSLSTTQTKDWQVKKNGGQFDQFTGATITPAAIVRAVHAVTQWYQKTRSTLYVQTKPLAAKT